MPRCLAAIAVALCFLTAASRAGGQSALRDGLEGPEADWRVGEADVAYRVESQGRVQGTAHSGEWCESLHIAAGNGTYLYLTRATPAARVIEELSATLWVKSDRAGTQLVGRIVLPRTRDPLTGKPVAVLARGTIYRTVGQWEQLAIPPLAREIEREARLLREQKYVVDTREAYLDALLLNVYAGPGRTRVLIDDVELRGVVERSDGGSDSAADQAAVGAASAGGGSPKSGVAIHGSQFLVDGRPVFPRAIRHRGEPLEFLKRLRFSAVWLDAAPTAELLAEASQAGIRILGPPPPADPAAIAAARDDVRYTPLPLGSQWDAVMAWDLGSGLTGAQLDAVRDAADHVRQIDRRLSRPMICDPVTDLRAYSRHADAIYPHRLPLGASLELADYATWLALRPRLARPGTPLWTVIQTQPSPALHAQWSALGAACTPEYVADEQVRLLVYLALSAGARGLLFESHSRLDAPDAAAKYRAAMLERVNLELSLVEPWIATGTPAAIVRGSDADFTGVVLQTPRSRLLLAACLRRGAQHAAGASHAQNISFVVPGVPEAHGAYEITPVSFQRAAQFKRVTGGLRVTLAESDVASLVLLTEDPLTIGETTRRVGQSARRAAQLERELLAGRLALADELDRELTQSGHAAADRRSDLSQAGAALKQCDAATSAGKVQAGYASAVEGLRWLRNMERSAWESVVGAGPAAGGTQVLGTAAALGAHRRLLAELRAGTLGVNVLPAGDCENLQRMLTAGWRHYRHSQPQVDSAAQIAPGGAHAGQFALALRAWPLQPNQPPELVESPPLWVTTAPVPARRGQWFRIRAYVRVPAPITGSLDGLLMIDSQGGVDLAERIDAAEGWTEVTMYRSAADDGELAVTFALTGIGEAWIDDVTIEPVQAAPAAAMAPRAPGF
ncbi:MAG: hypothetical protein HYS13_08725 [Planctomycetia bacterium]|nr:hypothetical protein [Planctomycetia bacterium]